MILYEPNPKEEKKIQKKNTTNTANIWIRRGKKAISFLSKGGTKAAVHFKKGQFTSVYLEFSKDDERITASVLSLKDDIYGSI